VYALPYIQSGADGYLSKLTPVSEFEVAIRSLLKTGTYFNEEIQQLWLSKLGQNLQHLTTNPLHTLSEREMTIVELINEGKWIKEIADILRLKTNTVSTYKKRIFEKLDVTNTKQLIQKVNLFKHL
jgi:two-component system invasion response regulator UvrY